MSKISIKKRLPKYYKVYEQIYENPSAPLYQMTKSTGISRSTISRYLIEMYDFSILQGPMIFVKPAKTCHQYASFLKFEYPLVTYKSFEGFPYVVSRSLAVGNWNLLLISEKVVNYSLLKGFKTCVLQSTKGATHLSKVTSLTWDRALERMYNAVSPPKKKSTLYEEIPAIPWKKKEWTLYHKFKYTIRTQAMPILKECRIRYERYQKWFSSLSEFAYLYTAFYPQGIDNYFMFDFLFQSQYQKQLTTILGMLPSTSIFFSVGDYLLARLALLNKKEKDDLFSLIFHLGEHGYFADFYPATVVSTSSTL